MKVCIDAGHYGKYNHSPVLDSYWESDMTWKLSQYLKQELNALGVETVMTRTSQAVDRELVSRGYASKGCDLFISEHSNAASSSTAAYALAIYMRENGNESYDEKSKAIAEKLAKVTGDTMGVGYRTYSKPADWDRDGNGKKDDEWYGVLQGAKQAKVPGIIMENGFHTNLKDAQWLSNDANLKKLAKAQAKCIADWGGVKPSSKPSSGSSQKKVIASHYATSESKSYDRTYTTTDNLNMRDGAGIQYKILVTLPKNTKVRCYKYYSKSSDGAIWLLVAADLNGVHYEGFVNKGWLK